MEKNKIRNIGMILASKFPPDIRIEKEAKALIENGYKVYLLCQKCNQKEKREDIINNIIIRRVDESNLLRRKINIYKLFLFFRLGLWDREIRKFVEDFAIDVLHIHDLPLVGTSLRVAKDKKVPIIADLHENYPAGLQVWTGNIAGLRKFLFKPLINLDRWLNYEKKCVKQVNKVIVVVKEAKERILKYAIPKNKVSVVSNTVDLEIFDKAKPDLKIMGLYTNKYIISYIGGFGPHRGIETSIKAMKLLKNKNLDKNIKLILVGKGSRRYEKETKHLVENEECKNIVEFLEWQPFEKVLSYFAISDIGLIPYYSNSHTNTTIPHKLFQYMAMKKPVVVSNCKPLKRIVNESKCGLVFESGNEKDLASQILKLISNKDLAANLGKNGRKAALKKYNWKNESKKLIEFYKQLAS